MRLHLDECHPCLETYDLQRTVKQVVARSCAEKAPDGLRERVRVQIREIQVADPRVLTRGHTKSPQPMAGGSFDVQRQLLGRLPWFALFLRRERRLRPVLPMVSSWIEMRRVSQIRRLVREIADVRGGRGSARGRRPPG